MSYHQLPAAFVANDYLCEFLLAQGLKETTDAASGPGCRDFQKSEGALALCITVGQAEIEVGLSPLVSHTYTLIPAPALLLILTAEATRWQQQHLFLIMMAELPAGRQGGAISELASAIEKMHQPPAGWDAFAARALSASAAGQLPPLHSQPPAH